MGRRYARKTGQRPQEERDLSIRAEFNDPPDLDKLCELLIRMSLRQPAPSSPSHTVLRTELASAQTRPTP
ncbi:hypothetical protein D3M95_06895 [Corynebacterium falsenii]|uniref:Uncharacterized protein n=1 Tax=Corynebacterium falsenii TaxID=108486 RepID=A0A418Q6M2_9CORY|nr:hypothetical protein D3M95_06895 [Corynebacterium falsenii]SBN95857.1 Hypothetical protein PFR_JS12-2_1473 [Propionibacterium freudenreichii]SCC97443.1 Hypothetical protein PFR_JS12-1_1475 [Propionibacterium freudenreichii]